MLVHSSVVADHSRSPMRTMPDGAKSESATPRAPIIASSGVPTKASADPPSLARLNSVNSAPASTTVMTPISQRSTSTAGSGITDDSKNPPKIRKEPTRNETTPPAPKAPMPGACSSKKNRPIANRMSATPTQLTGSCPNATKASSSAITPTTPGPNTPGLKNSASSARLPRLSRR